MKNINEKAQDLLLEIGLEVNKKRKPVTIARLCKKIVGKGEVKNKSTIYGRIEILEREGYIARHKTTGSPQSVNPTIKGWRVLGEEYSTEVTPEGVLEGVVDASASKGLQEEVKSRGLVIEFDFGNGLVLSMTEKDRNKWDSLVTRVGELMSEIPNVNIKISKDNK